MKNEKKIGVYFFILPVAGRNEKKNVCTYVFGYFSNSMCEKKYVYMYFWVIFQQLKKKSTQKVQQKRIWATAQLYCEKKKFVLQPCNCIARERARKKNCIGIVLQEKGAVGLVCIAREELYCKRMHVAGKLYYNMVVQWAEIVLQ